MSQAEERERQALEYLLQYYEKEKKWPDPTAFRVEHQDLILALDRLERTNAISSRQKDFYRVRKEGLWRLAGSEGVNRVLDYADVVRMKMRDTYVKEGPGSKDGRVDIPGRAFTSSGRLSNDPLFCLALQYAADDFGVTPAKDGGLLKSVFVGDKILRLPPLRVEVLTKTLEKRQPFKPEWIQIYAGYLDLLFLVEQLRLDINAAPLSGGRI